ncbi:hypothetical protein R1sor_015271 [Riccia sorocarpa]|uniref:Deoxynucleoside kinase domain-containing protein n=1 Tax=Riccia sorocarpa TaxID=122646 RepID=A0ABD3HES8_9MARC
MLHLLQKDPRLQRVMEVLEEPAHELWKNVSGTGLDMLHASYEDPSRYSYLFQSYVFITRFLLHNSPARRSKPAVLVTERSVSTDRIVFLEALLEQGFLDEPEAEAYETWYNAVVRALPNILADSFIYLRASPSVCYERLKRRAGSEEARVGLDYLQLLHRKHEDWFVQRTSAIAGHGDKGGGSLRVIDNLRIPSGVQGRQVLVVDCNLNLNLAEKSPERDALVDQIVEFLLSQLSQSALGLNLELAQLLINSESHGEGHL